MLVRVLDHPPHDGSDGIRSRELIQTRVQNRSDIETAIRRLDRAEWPIVWLYTGEPSDGAVPEQAALLVMDGWEEHGPAHFRRGGGGQGR